MSATYQNTDRTAQYLYALAEENSKTSPQIGDFRVTDGLKALAVGLVRGTAERLHGRPMSGIHQTLQRVGRDLVKEGLNDFAVAPVFNETEDGSPILTPVENPVTKELVLESSRAKLSGFGFDNVAVYSTCVDGTQDAATGPVYHHASLVSDTFFTRGLASYCQSPHCRANDFAFHVEIVRGILVLWAARSRMSDVTTKYTFNLLNKYGEDAPNLIDAFRSDLINARVGQRLALV